MSTVTIDRDALDDLLIYAARYAMGRYTYAPADVIAAVRAHPSRHVCEVLIEDVRQYAAMRERMHRPHLADWLALRDWMRERLAALEDR